MIYARPLTDEERQELKRMTRQEVGRVSQRALMILLSAKQQTVPEIAVIFDTSEATVRFWIERFNTAGPAGLYDQARSGRPRTVSQAVEPSLITLVQDDPQTEGDLATVWTVAMVTLAVLKLGITLSTSSVRGTWQRVGVRWGRPRLAMPTKTDPDKARQPWAIAKAVVAAGPEAHGLSADESRIQLLPLSRAMWPWVGQPIRVPTPGSNQTRAVFGALTIRTGQWSHLVRERMRKEDFMACLEHLLIVYPTGPIILMVDNSRSHTAGVVTEWLAEHSRLQLFYLPKYCSHLNPVESIWLRLKDKIAANRLYGSMKILLETVDSFFDEMTPEQALIWAAA